MKTSNKYTEDEASFLDVFTSNYKNFLWWLKSDNVIKTGKNEYRAQCNQYIIGMTRKEAYIYFKRNYSM
jgi:hypothetical protein